MKQFLQKDISVFPQQQQQDIIKKHYTNMLV